MKQIIDQAPSLIITDYGKVKLGLVKVKEPKPGEVLIRTDFSGVSVGTEMYGASHTVETRFGANFRLRLDIKELVELFPLVILCRQRTSQSVNWLPISLAPELTKHSQLPASSVSIP